MRVTKSFIYSTAITAALLLTGCANIDAIYRHGHLSKSGQTEFVDAKQRAIISAPAYEYQYKLERDSDGAPISDGKGGWKYDLDEKGNLKIAAKLRKYKFCSEPAPDVFSVRASSTSGKVSKEEGGNLGAMFGMSTAETGATIERTQVINMLRESMFRTCERYMNGAIDKDEMSVQTARDQRMMVATLAIDKLTGQIKRRPTILATSASTTLSADAKELIDKIVENEAKAKTLEAEVAALKTAKASADASYKALNEPEGAAEDAKPFCVAAKEADVAAHQAAASTVTQATPVPSSASTTTVTTTPPPTTAVSTPSPVLAGGATPATTPATPVAPAATPETAVVSVATPEQLAACNAAETTASEKTQALDKKKAELEEVRKAIRNGEKRLGYMRDSLMVASGKGDGDEGSEEQKPTHLAAVANTVQKITLAAFNDQSEINFACVRELRKKGSDRDVDLIKLCFKAFEGQLLVNAQLAGGKIVDDPALLAQFLGKGPSQQTLGVMSQNQALQNTIMGQNQTLSRMIAENAETQTRQEEVERAISCIAGWKVQPEDITPRAWKWIKTKQKLNNLPASLKAADAKRKEILNAC